jgi:hypothetical protein
MVCGMNPYLQLARTKTKGFPCAAIMFSSHILCSGQFHFYHWIGLRENLQETPIFNGKNHGFL